MSDEFAYDAANAEEAGALNLDTDFDLPSDAKPDPLIPSGKYTGSITKVGVVKSERTGRQGVRFTITLSDTGALRSDGETPVDGAKVIFNLWLPMEADKGNRWSDGREAWQGMVNSVDRAAKSLQVNMDSPGAISSAIANNEWIGKDVLADVQITEFEGQHRNEVKSLAARVDT